jgi:hypothetical protein
MKKNYFGAVLVAATMLTLVCSAQKKNYAAPQQFNRKVDLKAAGMVVRDFSSGLDLSFIMSIGKRFPRLQILHLHGAECSGHRMLLTLQII